MRGIHRFVEHPLVTADARRYASAEHTVRMAIVAGGGAMRAGQREARDAVIIWRTLPRSGGVAVGARGGKTELRVRWTLRGGEVLLVARLTHRGLSLEHVVGVAAATEGEAVCAGEGELRGAVIERRTLPRLHAVARRAQRRERRGRVRRRCGFVVVRGVTTHARHRLALEHAIRVASGAVHGAMRTRECKLREVVIVFGGVPGVAFCVFGLICVTTRC